MAKTKTTEQEQKRIELEPQQWLLMGPGPCIHRYHLPWDRTQCLPDCPGLQQNGVCLAELVQAANEQEVRLEFDVRPRIDVDPRWGGEWIWDGADVEVPVRTPPTNDPNAVVGWFECPHCGETNEQKAGNFHYWCGSCGKNATELEAE